MVLPSVFLGGEVRFDPRTVWFAQVTAAVAAAVGYVLVVKNVLIVLGKYC